VISVKYIYIYFIGMKFKVNGERNSGTNFLRTLLSTNFKGEVLEHYVVKKEVFFWKHAIPNPILKEKYPGIIDFFVVRDLNKWLVSMFKNVYHLKRFGNFKDFLTQNQVSNERLMIDAYTKKLLNEDDNNKTIFHIRYYKLLGMMDFFSKNNNIVIVNLDILQDEQRCIKFLEKVKKDFGLEQKNNYFSVNFRHLKVNYKVINEKNIDYNINVENYKDIIEKNKNQEIEDKLENICLIKINNKIKKIQI